MAGSGSQRLYSFKDILVLKIVKRLLDTGISLHNIRFLVRLGEQARAHILAGTFDGWSHEWLRRHYARGT